MSPASKRLSRVWPKSRPLRVGLGLVAALLVIVAANEAWHTWDRRDEKRTLAGVGNFGQLSPYLYRGAQPTHEGFVALKDIGVDTVVRFSTAKGQEAEQADVESLGMHFVALPWSSVRTPASDQVATFLQLLEERPTHTVFVHCKAGADRTGVMIALYRIAVDRWSVADAVSEMKAFHYRYYLLPHLESYVEAFPASLSQDPELQSFAPAD